MAILRQAFFWPFTFTDGGGFGLWDGGSTPIAIGNGPFLSPYAFAAAIKSELDANNPSGAAPFTVSYNTTSYRLTISAVGGFDFQFDTGDLQAAAVSGFSNSSFSGDNTYTADYSRLFNLWTPDAAVASDPGDLVEEPDTQVNLAVGGRGKTWFEARQTVRPLRFEFLYPHEVFTSRIVGVEQTALEYLWTYGRSRVRYWRDRAGLFNVSSHTGDYFLDQETVSKFRPERMPFQKELYAIDLGLRAYV